MPFCSDAVGLLGVALGTRELADSAFTIGVVTWMTGFLKKVYEMEERNLGREAYSIPWTVSW